MFARRQWKPQFETNLSVFLAVLLVIPPAYNAQAQPNGYIEYSVSGRDGQADKHGTSYEGTADQADDGRDGGDAIENPFKDGVDAGELYLNISYEQSQSGVTIGVEGKRILPGSRVSEVIRDQYGLDSSLALVANAVGGRGGDGGDGGRGERGGKGRKGSPAYHIGSDSSGYTPVRGGTGGAGGDGGDEGDSTSGGNAGKAGIVQLKFLVTDLDTAMLIKGVDVSGNKGGVAGKGRGAGKGGEGGEGGDSDSKTWQVSREEPVYSIDEKGNRYQSGTTTVWDTKSSYAPEGYSGPEGSPGRRSTKATYDGASSGPGVYEFVVKDENGVERVYPGPYNLILQPNYKLRGSLNNNQMHISKDGFFEPGETIFVDGLSVTNNGHSPTPKYQKIKLFISDSGKWIRSKSVELDIPQVLQPGESYTFSKESIEFYLAELDREEAGQLQETETLMPKARVTRIERNFKNFSSQSARDFRVRYPVEITPLHSMGSIAAGEVIKVLFRVRNVSTQTIGEAAGQDFRSARGHLRRSGGSTESNQFVLLQNVDGKLVDPSNGFSKALVGLKPGEEMLVEGLVGVGANPTPYTDVVVQPEIHLESNLRRGEQNLVQFEPFTIRVSQTFRHTPNADVLLVANHSLNEKVLDALRYTAQVKNVQMDVWDFSYYGFFNLHQSLSGWDHFFSAYRNKTIMIMGNSVKTPHGDTRVQSLLNPDDVIEAARRYGIRIFIIDTSEDFKKYAETLVAPVPLPPETVDPKVAITFSSPKQYLEELRREVSVFDEQIDGNDDHFLGLSDIGVSTQRLWGKPKVAAIEKHAAKLLERAKKYSPEASLFVDYHFKPEKTGWFKWDLGHLHVRRSVDLSRASVVSVFLSEKQIQDPNYILSDAFQSAFDIGLHLDTKLELIDQILSGQFARHENVPPEFKHLEVPSPLNFAKVLLQSVLTEILHEQIQVRPSEFGSGLSKEMIWDKLDILGRVTHYPYAQKALKLDSEEGKLWLEFISQIRFLNRDLVSAGQRVYSATLGLIFGKSKNVEISDVGIEMANRLTLAVFDDAIMGEAQALIKARVKELTNKEARSSSDLSARGYKGAVTLSGAEKWNMNSRIRNENDQAKLKADSSTRAQTAEIHRKAFSDQAHALRLPPDQCARILSQLEKN